MNTYTVTTVIKGRVVKRVYRTQPKQRSADPAKRCFYCHHETADGILGLFDEPVCAHCAQGPTQPAE